MLSSVRDFFCLLPIPAVPMDRLTISKLTLEFLTLMTIFTAGTLRMVLNVEGQAADFLKGSNDLLTCLLFSLSLRNALNAGFSFLMMFVIWSVFSIILDGISLWLTYCSLMKESDTIRKLELLDLVLTTSAIAAQIRLAIRSYLSLSRFYPSWLQIAAGLDPDQQHYVRLL